MLGSRSFGRPHRSFSAFIAAIEAGNFVDMRRWFMKSFLNKTCTDLCANANVPKGTRAIHCAARYGYVDILEYLMKSGAEINDQDEDGQMPIHIAAGNGHVDAIQLMLTIGANVNCQTKYGMTPTYYAAENGHRDVVLLLVNAGANINCQTIAGMSPIHIAAGNGYVDIVRILIKSGANVNCYTKDGQTPLFISAKNATADAIQMLIDAGAKANCCNDSGYMPIHVAAKSGRLCIVLLLVKACDNINCQTKDGWTPIFIAALYGHTEIVRLLIDCAANVNCQTKDGQTPIYVAALQGHADIVQLLLEASANVKCQTNCGHTLIHVAVETGLTDVVRFLIKSGVDVNCQNHYGLSPIYIAAGNGHTDIVRLMIECGADVNCETKNKWRPIHVACENGHVDVIRNLLVARCHINVVNEKNMTPVSVASASGHSACVRLLEEEQKRRQLDEREKSTLRYRLKQCIVGQDSAIDLISKTILKKETGWIDEEHPLVLLFLGSSGIGKTEAAKQIAKYVHKGNPDKGFIRIDMSEYQEQHAAASFIGAPPGYEGYDEGGKLTQALKECSDAVVLFDEVEKAHPDVLATLLQLFDEGRLTDKKYGTVECKNAIFIMTSNAASDEIAEYTKNLRLSNKSDIVEMDKLFKDEIVRRILKEHFKRNEFLGRIKEIVYFLPFSDADLAQLVKIELERWREKALKRHEIDLTWTSDILHYIAEGYDIYYGARSIKNEVDRRIINELAEAQAKEIFSKGCRIYLFLSSPFVKAKSLKQNNAKIEIKMRITDINGHVKECAFGCCC